MSDEGYPTAAPGEPMKQGFSMQMSAEVFRAYYDRSDYGRQYDRKGHSETTPKDPKFLSAREAWTERWKRLTEEGERLGYLERADCYECGGELEPTTEVEDRDWVYDETVEEHEARIAELGPYDPTKATRMDNEIRVARMSLDWMIDRPPSDGSTVTFPVKRRES